MTAERREATMSHMSTASRPDEPAHQSIVDDVVGRMVGMFAPEPTERARPEDLLLEDLGFTSLRLLELAFTLEELFMMDPATMGSAPPVGTVRDLSDFLAEKVSTGEATVPTMDAVEAAAAGL